MTTTELIADIPLDTAIAAHSGTSFVPEKRGESVREGYAAEMAEIYENLSAKCRNDSERSTLDAWWPRFRAVMRQLNLDYLHSQANIVSSFIAGPSNFPVARMEKRNRWAHNKLNHLFEVKARMLKRINRDLRPELRPIMAGDSDACQRLRQKIEQAEALQERMKTTNATIRKHAKAGREAQIAALVALGFETGRATRLLEPDFCGRIGFADFELTNNNANIRRMKQRLEGISRNQSAEATEAEGTNARFEDCPADNRVRLFFPGKPSEEIRSRLKHSGFRWSPTIGAWQAYRNSGTIEVAKREAGIEQLKTA